MSRIICRDYFGICPKLGGTISLWFSVTIGSVSHFFIHADNVTGNANKARIIIIFFMRSPLFLFVLYMAAYAAIYTSYIGIFTASAILATKSSNATVSWASCPRRRNVTVLSAASLSPTTAIIGVLASDSSRIL